MDFGAILLTSAGTTATSSLRPVRQGPWSLAGQSDQIQTIQAAP